MKTPLLVAVLFFLSQAPNANAIQIDFFDCVAMGGDTGWCAGELLGIWNAPRNEGTERAKVVLECIAKEQLSREARAETPQEKLKRELISSAVKKMESGKARLEITADERGRQQTVVVIPVEEE